MKSATIFLLVLVLLIALVGCAGGEIGFQATINRVEPDRNMAFATVTKQSASLFSRKLPESIMFDTSDLGEELKTGDRIQGDYLRGTINGQTVRVVSVVVLTD